MNDNAKLWVEELENFEQVKGSLRKGDKFCCLGVACEIYRRETGDGKWGIVLIDGQAQRFGCREGQHSTGALPWPVQKWLGLDTAGGQYGDLDEERISRPSLLGLNDEGKTFQEIAAVIRSEPEGLFVS